jgi:hypothetical protein
MGFIVVPSIKKRLLNPRGAEGTGSHFGTITIIAAKYFLGFLGVDCKRASE